jgi:threonine/homoserine/homoserine lactone efflux protein
VLTFFLIGFAAGVVTGVPIGPANVAVIDAAYRHTLRRAIAVGIGGSVADGVYASLGVLGVTPMLRSNPAIPPLLYGVSGVILVVFGLLNARSRPVAPATSDVTKSPNPSKEMWSGFSVGLALILVNPAAAITWVVIVGSFLPGNPSTADGLAMTGGVLIGSFLWFAAVAILTHRGKHLLGERAVWIPRLIGIALMGYGVFLFSKALKYWLG